MDAAASFVRSLHQCLPDAPSMRGTGGSAKE